MLDYRHFGYLERILDINRIFLDLIVLLKSYEAMFHYLCYFLEVSFSHRKPQKWIRKVVRFRLRSTDKLKRYPAFPMVNILSLDLICMP